MTISTFEDELLQLTLQLRNRKDIDEKYAKYRGDALIADKVKPVVGFLGDLTNIFAPKNWTAIGNVIDGLVSGRGLDSQSAAQIAGSMNNYSTLRENFINSQVKSKYDKMLHPPLTYLGDAFQYRTADGKFNSALNPHLGQAGAPYAKTVPSKTAPLGALPDPGDVFDKLMARVEGGRTSTSGLSSMLIYHATIIIHDIFRTNDNDKNISDSSSYLDLSPLYGYTNEMQRKIRDDKYKLGLLKPDTFAEDRLLRQPPGVCVMLVMYNRYHNYAAKMLYKINENNRFAVPKKYAGSQLVAIAKNFHPARDGVLYMGAAYPKDFLKKCEDYEKAYAEYKAGKPAQKQETAKTDSSVKPVNGEVNGAKHVNGETNGHTPADDFEDSVTATTFHTCERALQAVIDGFKVSKKAIDDFSKEYDAAWDKLDDDLFNTARLITCGIYIQISIHDYLRALMGFHQFDTNFTLDPRSDFDQKKTTRGIGNQVTVEFNLLYRFHCAISQKDEAYTEEFMEKCMNIENPSQTSLQLFLQKMGELRGQAENDLKKGIKPAEPWEVTFGIPKSDSHHKRNEITGLFDDEKLIKTLKEAMDDPISNFGPRNIPKCLRAVEILGIKQARKWETGTLNDFREFFGMKRHATFESMTQNADIQNALRDLYDTPDKVELYPGIFCEADEFMGCDPGPKQTDSALWTAIFSDAITLVRSDRFYTVDWNTNSLTSWGMNEVTANNEVLKSSVFHRLIQRAFPGWFPYNSVRFFHPFYTVETNAQYAREQGYTADFKMTPTDTKPSDPNKPKKPRFYDSYSSIRRILESDAFVHPAFLDNANLPDGIDNLVGSGRGTKASIKNYVKSVEPALKTYLKGLMQTIVTRESISMTQSTFQIDITRDFAIPVVTTYVADFLGFGHLLKNQVNTNGIYSENEIYQAITDCQMFLSYNPDETKLLKRRAAFKKSMETLIELTRSGVVYSCGQWLSFGSKPANPMIALGQFVAKEVLKSEKSAAKASAIILLICLDFAYKSVVSFTAVVDSLMKGLYAAAAGDEKPATWLEVQKLAFSESTGDHDVLEEIVLQTAHTTIKLPILRRAIQKDGDIKAGEMVVLDMHKATCTAVKGLSSASRSVRDESIGQIKFLSEQSTFAAGLGDFYPAHVSTIALTAMVKFVAQMRNARRGHDDQGNLKRVHLDYTAEGYSAFTAPAKMDWIAKQVEQQDGFDWLYNDDVLKPETDTYMTPSWDELVPFPMTWKVRFDGFGKSNYGEKLVNLKTAWVPDDFPPFYQPRGASHKGGAFAGVVDEAKSADEATDVGVDVPSVAILAGCKLPHSHIGA